MNKGLVDPSWSDSGDVPVGEVMEYAPITLEFKAESAGYGVPIPTACNQPREFGRVVWLSNAVAVDFTAPPLHFPDWSPLIDTAPRKPADPNAKPALPALTRVGGNKRGPGWCDE